MRARVAFPRSAARGLAGLGRRARRPGAHARTAPAVPNAVVTLYPGGRPAPLGPARRRLPDRPARPAILALRAGRAGRRRRSPSPISTTSATTFIPSRRSARFELRLYAARAGRAASASTGPGIVPLGCNIHDEMIAFINVVDTGLRGADRRAGPGGFAGVPGGAGGRAGLAPLSAGAGQPGRAALDGAGQRAPGAGGRRSICGRRRAPAAAY